MPKGLDEMVWKNIGIIKSSKDRQYALDVLEARRDFLKLRMGHESAIRKIYIDAADNVAKQLKSLKPTIGQLTRNHLKYLEKYLSAEAEKIQKVTEALMGDGIKQAVSLGGAPLDNHLLRAIQSSEATDILDVVKLQRGFADINTAAVETFWARTHKGLRVSDRIWQTSNNARDAMRNLIQTGLAQGRDAVKIARDLERYVRSGAKTLSKDYINMMARMGTRVPKDICYEALRLARTEYSKSFFEGVYSRSKVNPSYVGVRWMLSDAHPEPDTCDDLAQADLYGLGAGVYKKGEEPMLGHINCLCYVVPVLKDTDEFVEDLKEWVENSKAVPYLEKWYNGINKVLYWKG